MSSRMFPCSTISVVVLPAMPICASAGWISFCSTASKFTPAFVPKGRMMKARVIGVLSSSLQRLRVPLGDRQHMPDEVGLRARVGRTIAAEPRAELHLGALVFAHELRVRPQGIPEAQVIAPLPAIELDEVHVVRALDAFLESVVVFEVGPIRILVAQARKRQSRTSEPSRARESPRRYRGSASRSARGPPCFRRAARRAPAPRVRRATGPLREGTARPRVACTRAAARCPVRDRGHARRCRDPARAVGPCLLRRFAEMPFAYLAASEHDRQSSSTADLVRSLR